MKFLSAIITLVLVLSFNTKGSAYNFPGPKPKAILVQLRSESSRINGVTEANKPELLAQLKRDAAAIAAAMTADFNDNFKFCPVYYYVDTNSEKVINKQFEHVLMNADGSFATNLPINSSSHDYLIVFFGTAVFQAPLEPIVTDPSRYKYDPNHADFVGLVVNNDLMQQMTFLYQKSYTVSHIKRRWDEKYWYISSKFKMMYFPFATSLEDGLRRKYD